MLCKPCDQEATENTTVCPHSRTAAQTADRTEEKQPGRLSDSKAESCQDALTYRIQPEAEPSGQDLSPDAPPCGSAVRRHIYVPVGKEYVPTDISTTFAPKELPSASGIIYEIAEELYRREKTASDLEALCQPPFKRVFTQEQLAQLDRQASQRTRTLVAHAAASRRFSVRPVTKDCGRHISTSSAFWLQLLLTLPGINLIAALVLAFRKRGDPDKKAYSRAFLIWHSLFLSAALVFFAVTFFQEEQNRAFLTRLFTVLSA